MCQQLITTVLEGAADIRYEARDDDQGVVFVRQGEDEHRWTYPVIHVHVV